MNDNFANDIMNNEEFKEKVSKVQSKEEYIKLLKEYSISESDFGEVKDDELEKVSGGKSIIDVIEEHTFTAFQCTECKYTRSRQGYWLPTIEECPKCHKETFHAKQVFFA